MHWELDQAFNAFAADPEQWVAILTGAGDRAFCAGSDLKEMAAAQGAAKPMPPSGYGGLTHRSDLNKPVIAAVNGVAAGGGFEVALACDLIVATETARFGLPEPRVGQVAPTGLLKLPKQIPLKQAMAMILTGRLISARQGLEFGFVNEVAPPGEALRAALAWAQEICECSPLAVRASKQIAMRALDLPEDLALAELPRLPAHQAMRASHAREGPCAFAEKRTPQWSGR